MNRAFAMWLEWTRKHFAASFNYLLMMVSWLLLAGLVGWKIRLYRFRPEKNDDLYLHCHRNTQERWQHSGATISRIIHDVASSIIKCKGTLIRQASANDQLHARIRDDRKFREFSGCLGALDGVHIPAVVKQELIESFRNRKKFVSQNVLGVCDFDMLFTYCLAGWEGSAHDGCIFADAAVKGLTLP
jgi:DDE superfamily endonuclease